MEKSRLRPTILMTAALLFPWALANAQQQSVDESAEPAIEPSAIAALEKMSAYLRTLKTYELQAETTTDEVLESGQKIQFGNTVNYRVQMPDRLFVDVASDRKQRQYFYDGKTVTLYAPRMKYYAVFDAPTSIRETVDAAQDKYAIDMPLSDLFLWGTEAASTEDLTDAIEIGPSMIGDEQCDHYAYRQEDVDWQLWIRQGEQPLPCKLVITTTDEESQPQYSAVMTWNLTPTIDPAGFTFVAPDDAHKIAIRPADTETQD
ncbi:MAG: DUF2092 domain-containing protein [Candidatus Competibacteraceae bacterium]|nr:DUF2092 domain-containing protein [Candidatus Competibacteraceae bacterium]